MPQRWICFFLSFYGSIMLLHVQDPVQKYSVRGKVVDNSQENLLKEEFQDLTLFLYSKQTHKYYSANLTAQTRELKFVFENIPAGDYTLHAGKLGFIPIDTSLVLEDNINNLKMNFAREYAPVSQDSLLQYQSQARHDFERGVAKFFLVTPWLLTSSKVEDRLNSKGGKFNLRFETVSCVRVESMDEYFAYERLHAYNQEVIRLLEQQNKYGYKRFFRKGFKQVGAKIPSYLR